ncbi:D-alanyl-lipoteichoic acid biosynthesis protein DltD [Desulfitobacterium metallireducens]|uniref:Protein DltD n=1 Tax=Desulfitobacterium metallireducens DSM 15288 TaxID=871968 RepID=W0EBE7_9FIRM|nr:D-alanyl-lipoteichoic acid biosynthesis protein DltD [Desulfitobacterium metallireducens]AHF08092.1 alanine transporter [Desulfitobacterium metallireducens DSM 15288]
MIKRRWVAIGLSLVLFTLTLGSIVPIGRILLDRFAFKSGVLQAIASSQTPVAFQGLLFQEKALIAPDILPVYGSSEFSAESEFHPSKLFDAKPTGFVPFLLGRGGSQSLVHVLSLAAQGETLHDKKVVVILSPQWFVTGGIATSYLDQNFSPLQAYQILYDPNLSEQIKQELSHRLLEFPEVLKKYPILKNNLVLYSQQETPNAIRSFLMIGVGRIDKWRLEVQDLYKVATFVPLVNREAIARNAVSLPPQTLDWVQLRENAQKRGLESTKSNSWGIVDSYYKKYIEPELAQSFGSEKGAKLNPSPEYQDLQLLMKVLKEQEAKALFVIVPVNGFWYDYIGFLTQERTAYYTRIREMSQHNGFEVADFSQHEYDRYFLQDIMHLGWKGWVAVDQAMDQFYHERS